MASEMTSLAGYKGPYELGVAYANGKPVGKVTEGLMSPDQADPDRLRPYIEYFIREEIVPKAQLPLEGRHPC